MRKKQFFICLSLGLTGLLSSCSSVDEEENEPSLAKGMGQLTLNLAASNGFGEKATRAVNEADYLNTDNYTIQVLDASNEVKASLKGNEASTPIQLTRGDYTVKAFYGEIGVGASTDKFYVEGTSQVTVKAAETVTTTVNCVAQAAKVTVNFNKDLSKYLSDYNVTFGGTNAMGDGNITWSKEQKDPIYFQTAQNGDELDYTINVTCKDDYLLNAQTGATTGQVSKSFTVQRNKSYTINVNLNISNPGSLQLTIEIDDSTNDIPLTWTVPVEWTK